MKRVKIWVQWWGLVDLAGVGERGRVCGWRRRRWRGGEAEGGTDGTQTLRQSSWCWAAWSCQRCAASGPDWLTRGECAPRWTGRSSATAGRSPCQHLRGSGGGGWVEWGWGGATNMLASKGQQQQRSSSVIHPKDNRQTECEKVFTI